MKKITFKELLAKYQDEEIVKRLVKLYPHERKNKEGYYEALSELRDTKPKKDNMEICLHKVRKSKKFLVDEAYVTVNGRKQGSADSWALDLTPWSKLLTMKINSYYNQLDTLAYCLWEFTFNGYSSKSVEKLYVKIMKSAKEAKKQ